MTATTTMGTTDNSNDDDWADADFLTFDNGADEKDEAGNDDMNEEEEEESNDDLPPWMSREPRRNINPLVRLHNEIVDFCSLMEPRKKEIEEREDLVKKFRVIADSCFGSDAQVKVFGSQATGLLLPTSDIDVVIILKEEEESEKKQGKDKEDMENYDVTDASSKSPLLRLGTALREAWYDDLEYLEVIEKTRVPLVKLTIYGLSMDVCFNQENGPKAAQLMKTYLQAMPPLRPLTFVLKYFLASRGLNEPYSGGIGSYMLQLMIVSFLQHRERDSFNFRRPSVYNLGCLLVEFLELYGMDLNYMTTGISVRHDGFYFAKGATDRREAYYMPNRPFSLAVENPLDPAMDVGKGSFKIQTIQRSFEVAFKMLLAHVAEPVIRAPSILASILPPSSEMHLRTGKPVKKKQCIVVDDVDDDMKSPDRKRRRRA